ncbi:uncharacterized protein LOC130989916 isoform X2 [Salvia miltiorrhiza]|uniref:uncharacterized protein LOC130989914 isoform X2 n=1 Tax=Salvia miltiorrhiza TaxID=226208 RepID=UPI0025AD0355|nr:uncharacterized protein LOC130989914 isoform X2 [Salvia miltiorrhiza]XP_057770062.1 uncharacterized protein LOC130989914 isoform X2 [Salvia miltiorrhiza]XP_057770065.1 uncharacterized protein LOC130989916 isoform X2 [Salvia miltiorrhiza]XP_057770066.1 uncharacterized protein LOC130989916 isoform X2 [Salvia miltiorrhiza]
MAYCSSSTQVLYRKGGQALVDRFLGGCFGHLLDWNPGAKCGMALHHVVSRQIQSNDNGLWFYINGSKLHFSEMHYALVTGLNFGQSDFDVRAEHDLRNVEVFIKICCGRRTLNVDNVIDIFENYDLIGDPDGSLLLRVAHVIVLYGMLLGYERDKKVADWVWALVDHVDAFNQFPWGAYTYQILCQYAYNCSTNNQYKLYGPVWALHVWSLEIIPELGSTVGTYVEGCAHPRCLRWKFRSRPNVSDLRPLFEQEAHHLFEIQPDDYETTSHYYATSVMSMPIGVHYERPVNPLREGRQFSPRPTQDIRVAEHELPRRREDRLARSRDKGKRSRPPPTTSSSSSGDHVIRGRDRDYIAGVVKIMGEEHDLRIRRMSEEQEIRMRRMAEEQDIRLRRMAEEQEIRMRRHNEDLESRMKRTLKGFLDDLKGFFSCSVVHRKGVHSPAPRRTPTPETRDCDDVQLDDGGPVADDVSHHAEATMSMAHRHSVHEYGNTSTSHQNPPRFSLQNPPDYNFDPRHMEYVMQGLTTEGLENLLLDIFKTPSMPPRSERERSPDGNN